MASRWRPAIQGSLYFRNAPSVVDAGVAGSMYWDGRLDGGDMPTLVRDHVAEAHAAWPRAEATLHT